MQSRSGGSDWDRVEFFIAESARGVQSRPQLRRVSWGAERKLRGWMRAGGLLLLALSSVPAQADEARTPWMAEGPSVDASVTSSADPPHGTAQQGAAPRETPHTVMLETGTVGLDSYFRTYSRSTLGVHYLHDLPSATHLEGPPGLIRRVGGGLRIYWPQTLAPLPLEVFGEVQVVAPVGLYQPGLSVQVGLTGVSAFFVHNRSMEDGSAQEEASRALPLYAEVGAAPLRFRPQHGTLHRVTLSLLELHLGTLLLPPGRVGRTQLTLASVGGHF